MTVVPGIWKGVKLAGDKKARIILADDNTDMRDDASSQLASGLKKCPAEGVQKNILLHRNRKS
jgi:hypothetical protein